ncbi:hypothetical protein F4860DRAFT_481654 [Xylaria cubensis]|nr:hypothetical protein F4860DRAFT_481654 [Xylaria cubensis]
MVESVSLHIKKWILRSTLLQKLSSIRLSTLPTCTNGGYGGSEYRQRYKDQQSLLESGIFVQATVAALALLPSARHLKFKDDLMKLSYTRRGTIYELSNGPVEMGKKFIKSLSALKHGTVDSRYNLPGDIIGILLGALPDAGIGVDNVRMDFGRMPSNAVLVPSFTTYRNTNHLAERLGGF